METQRAQRNTRTPCVLCVSIAILAVQFLLAPFSPCLRGESYSTTSGAGAFVLRRGNWGTRHVTSHAAATMNNV